MLEFNSPLSNWQIEFLNDLLDPFNLTTSKVTRKHLRYSKRSKKDPTVEDLIQIRNRMKLEFPFFDFLPGHDINIGERKVVTKEAKTSRFEEIF